MDREDDGPAERDRNDALDRVSVRALALHEPVVPVAGGVVTGGPARSGEAALASLGMRLPRRLVRALGLMDHTVTVVVFTVPEKRLREMDVATGPCVATGGRQRALAGLSRQDGGELPEHTSGLYTALTGRPADGALALLAQEGEGRLSTAEPDFVAAMADAYGRLEALREADLAGGDEATTWWTARQSLDQAWLAAGHWPRGVTSTSHRLDRLYWAHAARERGQHLYVWHGPAVPMYEAVAVDAADR